MEGGAGGTSNIPLGNEMGWRRSRFSARRGEEIVTLTARIVDVNSLLCKFELLRQMKYGKANS
jgi:hypothetical protein